MRLILLLPVLFSVAAPAYAEERARAATARPRLGRRPPRPPRPLRRPDAGMGQQAPSLDPLSPPPAAAAPVQPAPLAAWAGYQTPPAAPPPTAAPAAAPPTSLYAAPRPAPPRVPTAALAAGQGLVQLSAARASRPRPRPRPSRSPPPAGRPAPATIRWTATTASTPDAAPPCRPRQPRPGHRHRAAARGRRTLEPMHGSADWLAAGARGDRWRRRRQQRGPPRQDPERRPLIQSRLAGLIALADEPSSARAVANCCAASPTCSSPPTVTATSRWACSTT